MLNHYCAHCEYLYSLKHMAVDSNKNVKNTVRPVVQNA